MNDEGKFWVAVWKVVGCTFVACTAIVASCSTYQARAIEAMVRSGADPLAADCAINGTEHKATCVALAVKARKD